MVGSERISIYCLCNLLQTKKKLLLLPPSTCTSIWDKPQSCSVGSGEHTEAASACGQQPLPALTPNPARAAAKEAGIWNLWALGGGERGVISVAGQIALGFD